MNRYIAITAMLLISCVAIAKGKETQVKPRLVVCTDIAPGDAEPDDMESMVRLMIYADCFEIEALITSVGWNCDPYPTEWKVYLTRVIEAYRKDVIRLMNRSGQKGFLTLEQENGKQQMGYWPSADYLTEWTVMGSQHGGIKAIGENNDTPGSQLLMPRARSFISSAKFTTTAHFASLLIAEL